MTGNGCWQLQKTSQNREVLVELLAVYILAAELGPMLWAAPTRGQLRTAAVSKHGLIGEGHLSCSLAGVQVRQWSRSRS